MPCGYLPGNSHFDLIFLSKWQLEDGNSGKFGQLSYGSQFFFNNDFILCFIFCFIEFDP